VTADPLLLLSAADLREIASALEGGRLELRPRISALSVAQWAAPSQRAALASGLEALDMEAPALARMLRLLASQRHALESAVPSFSLVWTGPEIPGSASRSTATVARQLFQRARRSVLVSTYAIYDGRTIFSTLAERMDAADELAVRLFVNVPRTAKDAKASDEDLVWAFAKAFRKKHWPGERLPEVYYDPRSLDADAKAVLHAKVIVVDDEEAFISSANFTESAQERNIEAGVHFRQASLAMALRRQFDSLVAKKRLRRLPLS